MSRLISRMLRWVGNVKIVAVSDHVEALAVINADPKIDLMITTIDPPGTFEAFTEEVRKRCHGIRIILLSNSGETFSLKCVEAIILRESGHLITNLLNRVRDLLPPIAA